MGLLRMRLLYLCSDFGIDPQGTKGASIHLRAITLALSDQGHQVQLLSPKNPPPQGHPAKPLLIGGSSPAEKTSKLLKRWLVEKGFNDAVARELRPLIYNAYICEPALKELTENPPQAIIERLSLFSHVGLDLAQALNIPLIVEANAPLAHEASTYRNLQLGSLAREIEQKVLRQADAVVVVSRELGDRFAQEGVNPDRIHVVPNGADLSLFENLPSAEDCRKALNLNDQLVIGFAGSLKVWHGVDLLISAFGQLQAQHPHTHLLIVGSGPEEVRLQAMTEEMGLTGAVTFTGAVAHAEVPRHLKAMDIAVAPFRRTKDFYFSPIKLFEYMAAGSCVVASRLGQITDVIEEGVDGRLFEPDDENDLVSVLVEVMNDLESRRLMTQNAQNKVQETFTWAHAATKISDVLKSVLELRKSSMDHTLSRLQ